MAVSSTMSYEILRRLPRWNRRARTVWCKQDPRRGRFDLDGTLLDTETIARELFISACREIGCSCEMEVYEETVGLNVRQAHDVFFERLGPEFPYPELRKLSSRWFSERLDQGPVDLKQGAIELLAVLETREVPVGLCTSTGRKTVENQKNI